MNEFEKNPEDFGWEVEVFEQGIHNAQTFDELFDAVRKAGGIIESSQETITVEKFIEILESTREAIRTATSISSEATDKFPILAQITRAHGLREKVKELLLKERNSRKEELGS